MGLRDIGWEVGGADPGMYRTAEFGIGSLQM